MGYLFHQQIMELANRKCQVDNCRILVKLVMKSLAAICNLLESAMMVTDFISHPLNFIPTDTTQNFLCQCVVGF